MVPSRRIMDYAVKSHVNCFVNIPRYMIDFSVFPGACIKLSIPVGVISIISIDYTNNLVPVYI